MGQPFLMHKNRITVLTVLLFFQLVYSYGQYENLNFFSLSRMQGLSDNSVTSIVKDQDGFIWIGTHNGLNRYDGYEFKQFFAGENKNTLTENSIVRMLVSSEGTLWIGLEKKGLCRYDTIDESFERISFVNGTKSLAADMIQGIVEDKDSILYVATSEGLYYLTPGENEFQELPFDNSGDSIFLPDALLSSSIAAITADEDNGIWIAYPDWRVSYYDPNMDYFQHFSFQEFSDKSHQTLISALAHSNGKLYIGSVGSSFIEFDPVQDSYEVLFRGEGMTSVREINVNQQDQLWIATGNGLINYNLTTKKYHRFTNIEADIRSLSTTATSCSFQDDDGIIWVGLFSAGINYAFLNEPFEHFLVGLNDYYSLRWKDVSSVMHDRDGNLWIGYMGGLVEFHNYFEKEKYTIPISSLTGFSGPGSIFSLFQSSNGQIYAGSWSGGLQIFNESSGQFEPITGEKKTYLSIFEGVDIRDIEEDGSGRLWLAVHGKGVVVYDRKRNRLEKYRYSEEDSTTISNDWVFDICLSQDNTVWVATAWGLSRIYPRERTVKRYYTSSDSLGLTDDITFLVEEDNQGNIWVGTDKGLNFYDRTRDIFYPFDVSNGLPENQIRSMEQDSAGYYWVSTATGIFRFTLKFDGNGNPVLTDIHSFNNSDGLQSEYYNFRCSSRDLAGSVYFGGDNGVDFFDPNEIKPVEIDPKLEILEIEIAGEPVYPGSEHGPKINKTGEIVLQHRQNLLSIEYTALNYFNNKRNIYSYVLHPLQKNWIIAENNRYVMFSNLKPGHYTFSLKVESGKGNIHQENDILKFYIKPPLWKTNFFRIIIIIILIGMVIAVVRIYTYQLRKNKNILEKTVKERTRELWKNNRELEERSMELNQTNILLKERQKQIERQTIELKKQSEELKSTNQELSVLNTMKDKFFSIIAHDLKNPFYTIVGFTDLLREGYSEYDDEKRKEMIEYIYHSVNNAQSLLENLLHWSRSQTNQLHVRPDKLVLKDIVERNHALVSPMLDKKRLNFNMKINRTILVLADVELLNTVLRNLFSNAIKFTQENGKILVQASPVDNDQIQVEVRDNGLGIDPEELKSIFRIDTKVTRHGTAGEVGTGLGMILCKEFVNKMNGEIWIESRKGEGTSIFFTLPVFKS